MVASGTKVAWVGKISPAPAGFGRGVAYDSAKAYDEIARAAVSFAIDENPGLEEYYSGAAIRRSPAQSIRTARRRRNPAYQAAGKTLSIPAGLEILSSDRIGCADCRQWVHAADAARKDPKHGRIRHSKRCDTPTLQPTVVPI